MSGSPNRSVAVLAGSLLALALGEELWQVYVSTLPDSARRIRCGRRPVTGGLKEIGEPARKSLIVDLSPEDRCGATVGLYYGIRNMLVVPAGVLGGVLWQQSPQLPLESRSW